MIARATLFVAILVLSQAIPVQGDEPTLSPAKLKKWIDFITPAKGELRWQKIPWRSQYWTAVVEAQAADKPILLWAMNGHPLGCT